MDRRFSDWVHYHFVPSSVFTISVLLLGIGFYLFGLITLDFGWIIIGLATAVLPVVVCLLMEYINPGMDVVYFGYLFSYELNDDVLYFKVFRTIPIFRVPISAVRRIEPRRTRDRGLKKLNFMSFLTSDLWFWPVPLHMVMRVFSKIGHERWNYALRTDTGWTIIIAAPHEFISMIGSRLRRRSSLSEDDVE